MWGCFTIEPLDPLGTIVFALSLVSLLLLILALPSVRGIKGKKNLKQHGILTITALTLQTILVFTPMIPSTIDNFDDILNLQPLFMVNTWLHIVLGFFALVSSFVYVGLWLLSWSGMGCARAKKYMLPTFIIWIITISTGALTHFLQMF